jgi:DNA invertase Pin-like site-specific DNA recombinase
MTAKKLAVSYARWSDPKQDTGDSKNRQERLFRTFCQIHNLTPSGTAYVDEGMSSYRGKHRKKGRLKDLVEAAQNKAFEKGTVIVIETWNRLGRMEPDKMIDLIRELLDTGVSIGVCQLNTIYTKEDAFRNLQNWSTLSMFVGLAHEESKQKATWVAAAWKSRRDRVREGNGSLPCQPPAWVEVTNYEKGKGGTVRVIPERAAAIKRIYQLAAAGYGQTRIIKTLTAEGYEPFAADGTKGRTVSHLSGRWTRAYVHLLLRDRRVLGEVQLKDREGNPDGPPVKGYLPAVVSEEEFALARAEQARRRGRDRVPTEKRGAHVNVFKGLIRHARDGESYYLHDGGAKGGGLVLRNRSGEHGRSKNYTINYAAFEEAILSLLREVDPRDVLPGGKETPDAAGGLRARLGAVRQDIAGLQADLRGGYSKALSAVLREKEIEEEQIATRLQEELAKAARHAERDWEELPNLAALVKEGGDEARLALAPVLRRVVSEMWLLPVRRGSFALAAAQVFFSGADARRDYLIVYRSAGRCRAGGSWRESFREAEGLDLRKPAHVRQLELVLLGADLDRFALRPLPR